MLNNCFFSKIVSFTT